MIKYLFSAGFLALASAAYAEPVIVQGNPAPSERVSFADLNLASQAGIDRLQVRIRSAAGRLCLTHGVVPLRAEIDANNCYRAAIGNAYGEMNRIVAARDSGVPLVALAITVSAAR